MKRKKRSAQNEVPHQSEKKALPSVPQWIPLSEIMDLLHHPDFYWGAHQDLVGCKYLQLRIDTRDNCALVSDRNGRTVDFNKLQRAVETPLVKGMNSNPPMETVPRPKVTFADYVLGLFRSSKHLSPSLTQEVYELAGALELLDPVPGEEGESCSDAPLKGCLHCRFRGHEKATKENPHTYSWCAKGYWDGGPVGDITEEELRGMGVDCKGFEERVPPSFPRSGLIR